MLITGASGFVGKNLQLYLAERKDVEVVCFTREHAVARLPDLLQGVDIVFHLAGINRPQDPAEFLSGNVDLTHALCQAVAAIHLTTGKKVPVIFTSSTQTNRSNAYGDSKVKAENALFALQRAYGVPVHVFRLPNVFGKWCKPNYNRALCGAKVALCFLSKLNQDTCTRRCFEIPATKTLMLSEYTEDLANLYKEGQEADFFRTKDELIKKLGLYLGDEMRRQLVAENSYRRVVDDGHDVNSRMEQFLVWVNQIQLGTAEI